MKRIIIIHFSYTAIRSACCMGELGEREGKISVSNMAYRIQVDRRPQVSGFYCGNFWDLR
jgi:hypothetical protein